MTVTRILLLVFGTIRYFPASALAAEATNIVLSASSEGREISSPIQLVFPVQLTASVSPAPPDGEVTFYDGTVILGTVPVKTGIAMLVTKNLSSGRRYLRARFVGSNAFEGSVSQVVSINIFALESYGFRKSSLTAKSGSFLPFYVATGDFNGDGHLDLAIANQWSNTIGIFLGDGTGRFSEAPNSPFAAGASPVNIVTADFDGDGQLDVMTANYDEGTVSLLLGNGDGSFAPQVKYAVGVNPTAMTVADFDNNGTPDVAVANFSSNSLTLLLGKHSSGLRIFQVASIPAGPGPAAVVAGDFNGDGNADLASANSHSNGVDVFLGDGNGSFSPPSTFRTEGPSKAIIAADFDSDGSLDLLTANTDGDILTLFLGDGHGGFLSGGTTVLPNGSQPFALAAGDFNQDGNVDLAIANYSSSSVGVYFGSGHGTFQPSVKHSAAVGAAPVSLALGDFSEDGRIDIAVADNGGNDVTVLLANPELTISLQLPTQFTAGIEAQYSILVKNAGNKTVVFPVYVTNVLPQGLNAQASSRDGWNCSPIDPVANKITCSIVQPLAAGESYKPILVSALITPNACPVLTNSVMVQNLNAVNSDVESTPVTNCLAVTQEAQSLHVNLPGTISLSVSATGSVAVGGSIMVSDVLPTGIVPTPQVTTINAGNGWRCSISGQLVQCARLTQATSTEYPPINIPVNVMPSACPSASNYVSAVMTDSGIDVFILGPIVISGCLQISATSADFGTVVIGQANASQFDFTVTSLDNNPLSISVSLNNATSFSERDNCGNTLNQRGSCAIKVTFSSSCVGEQNGMLSITARSGGLPSTYNVPIRGIGSINSVALVQTNGTPLPVALMPGAQYSLGLVFQPPLNSGCPQTPSLSMAFQDDKQRWPGVLFDNVFDPVRNVLSTGTVAGQIELTASLNGSRLVLGSAPAKFDLKVPSITGVIDSLTVANKTSSSFELQVTGYSTPREINSNSTTAKTEVCFSFQSSAGAEISGMNNAICALQGDIEIWYERPGSYGSGSRFKGSVVVSFSGDIKAVGNVQAVIQNQEGPGPAACVNVASGAKCN